MKTKKTNYSEVLGVKIVELIDYVVKIVKKRQYTPSSTPFQKTEAQTPTPNEPSTVLPNHSNQVDSNKSPNGVYLDWENKRMLIKDAVFILSAVGFLVFALYVGYNKDSFIVPTIRYSDGTHLEGNCDFIWKEFKTFKNLSGNEIYCPRLTDMDYSLNKSVIPTDDFKIKIMTTVPTTTTMAAKQTDVCPACNCPTVVCPECQCSCPYNNGLSQVVIRQSLNVRPKSSNSPAYSAGCFQCLKDNWIVLGIPLCDGTNDNYCRPKYNPAPSTGFYDVITGTNLTQDPDMYIFKIQDGSVYGLQGSYYNEGIFLNTSLWNVTRIKYEWVETNTYLVNKSGLHYYKTNSTMHSNYTKNLWLKRL